MAPKGPVRAGRGRALLHRAGVHGGVLCCSPLGEALEGEEKLARWRCERPFRVQRTGRRRWARARQVQGQVWRLGPGGSRTGQLGTVWACPSPAGSPCAGPARKPSGSSRTQARGPEPPEAFSCVLWPRCPATWPLCRAGRPFLPHVPATGPLGMKNWAAARPEATGKRPGRKWQRMEPAAVKWAGRGPGGGLPALEGVSVQAGRGRLAHPS